MYQCQYRLKFDQIPAQTSTYVVVVVAKDPPIPPIPGIEEGEKFLNRDSKRLGKNIEERKSLKQFAAIQICFTWWWYIREHFLKRRNKNVQTIYGGARPAAGCALDGSPSVPSMDS
jgi:hypothetical protein